MNRVFDCLVISLLFAISAPAFAQAGQLIVIERRRTLAGEYECDFRWKSLNESAA